MPMTWPRSGLSTGFAQAPLNGLSVDVEDWFQVGAFETRDRSRADWDGAFGCRVERNCDVMLRMFAECRGEGHVLHAGLGGATLSRADPPYRR